MNTTVEKKANCEAELHVEVPAETVKTKRQAIINRYRKLAKVPGFRPGKAPTQVVEKRFAPQIDGELREAIITEGLRAGSKEHDLKVLSVREVGDDTFQPDGAFTFMAYLTLEPEIELPPCENVPVEAPPLGIDDTMVDARLDGLREQFADFGDAEGRPLVEGDIAVISYTGSLDGTPLDDAIEGLPAHLVGREDHWLRTDDDGFLPGLAAQILGMNIGEKKDGLEVIFPEEFPVESLQGKVVSYDVTLVGIKEKNMPEADDEFAARILPGKSLEDLRAVLRERLEEEQREHRRSLITDQILTYLDRSVNVDLPSDLVQNETQRQVDEIVQRGAAQGLDNDAIAAEQDRIFASASAQAKSRVKNSFILEKIAEKEELKVSEADILAQVQAMASQANKPVRKVFKQLQKENALGGIRNQILLSKALDFVVSKAAITEVAPPDQEQA